MYESPVTIIENVMETIIEEREGRIIAKIQDAFDVHVDKAELIRALQYDRGQYEKGYADGKADAMAEWVRCKDCKYGIEDHEDAYLCDNPCNGLIGFARGDDFCSYGERKGNG